MSAGDTPFRDPHVDLFGCTFSGNSADIAGDDISNVGSNFVMIYGCPSGYFGVTGSALDISEMNIGFGFDIMSGEKISYSCGACAR